MDEITVELSSGPTHIAFGPPLVSDNSIAIADQNTAAFCPWPQKIIVPAGESSKNFANYERILLELAKAKASRKTQIVAFGGGVMGDLAGFASATYMRGTPLVQVPTTLLAMVDSSVGGKVGIDMEEGKNLVGAFHPARQVFIHTEYLNTLPDREFRCGMAEVIKYGFIQDSALLDQLERTTIDRHDPHGLTDIIRRCIELKKLVVEEDEFETKGSRAILNFGHTVGHALETLTDYKVYTHGEAIAIGMVAELKVGEKLGMTEKGLANRACKVLSKYALPFSPHRKADVDMILEVMRRDKKSEAGELAMSLVAQIGQCSLISKIDPSIVREVLIEL